MHQRTMNETVHENAWVCKLSFNLCCGSCMFLTNKKEEIFKLQSKLNISFFFIVAVTSLQKNVVNYLQLARSMLHGETPYGSTPILGLEPGKRTPQGLN